MLFQVVCSWPSFGPHNIEPKEEKKEQLVGGCVSCGGVRVPIYNTVLENFISMTINSYWTHNMKSPH
jgi:hypothetical protein